MQSPYLQAGWLPATARDANPGARGHAYEYVCTGREGVGTALQPGRPWRGGWLVTNTDESLLGEGKDAGRCRSFRLPDVEPRIGVHCNLRRRSPLAAKVFFSFVSALC